MVKVALTVLVVLLAGSFPGTPIGDGPIALPVPIELPDCLDVVCATCPPGSAPIYSTHECCPICTAEIE